MARPRWKRLGIAAIKLAVAVVVLWAVGRHVSSTWSTLDLQKRPLHFEPVWLLLSGVLYLVGLTFSGMFFHRVMRESPSPVGCYPAIRAYLVSHLAKYVPGKAMVVVVRAGMVVPYGARGVTAAIATFYETLTMMAAGGLIAAICFGTTSTRSNTFITFDAPKGWDRLAASFSQIPLFGLLVAAGLALGLAFLVVVWPSVFAPLTRLVTTPFGGAGADTSPRWSLKLLSWGLLWSSLCWFFLGLSQLAVVRSMSPLGFTEAASLAPLAIGSVAIATVAGFVVAVLPGGLGVREGVLMAALGPAVGDGIAVASALLLRLVWIAGELMAAGVLAVIRPQQYDQPLSAPTSLPAELEQDTPAPAEIGPNRS